MPEEESTGTDLEKLLDHLEDYTLNVHNYQSIQNALDKDDNFPMPVIEKLLALSVRDLKEDMKNSVNMLNIIFTVVKKIKSQQPLPLPDLVPSAIGVLHILKTTALFNKVEALKNLCFEIIMSYPDETLITLVENHTSEVMEIFNLYCHQRIPQDIRLQPITFITKLLKILPPDKKAAFVKGGMIVWFSKIIPTISCNSATVAHGVEALELITEDLIHIDYADNPQWRIVLQNIYTPQKYPNLMKSLLESGNDNWYRLWIVYIKLLKNQITKSTNTVGSPINSMLPVVELAFKMDVANRCRAFTCWNVLIDNFSTETNEVYINKRIKLLIIPLMSNNAKVEETALAKLKTWWHLINRFYPRLDKFSDIILMPFLHFCFGKSIVSDKPVLIPGLLTQRMRNQCLQAFINIVGHEDCGGCVTFSKLKGKVLSTKLLVSHWRDWIHALNTTIKTCMDCDGFTEQQIKCIWKSFVMTIGELPENNIRRDLFNEILVILEKLAEGCNDKTADIILNVLIIILFNKNEKIQPLLKSKDDLSAPIHKIITVILKLPLSNLENKHFVVQNFKILSTFLVEEAFKTSSHTIECILKYLPQSGLLIWIALAETICELLYTLCPRMLCKMILWPLKYLDKFLNEKLATTAWINMYKCVYPALHITTINEDIIKLLLESNSKSYFILEVAITILHQKIISEDGSKFINEVMFLKDGLSKVNNFQDIISIFLPLSELIIVVLTHLCKNIAVATFENIVLIIDIIMKLFFQISKEPPYEVDIIKQLELIFKALESNFKVEAYSKFKFNLLKEIKSCASHIKKYESLKDSILFIYVNKISKENIENDVQELVNAFDEDEECIIKEKSTDQSANFTTPSSKPAPKRYKKKEANIVDTVTENGEEFVVVKSNWKFNPRKLTDNQKEKLQKKREDIPALYQDLSQSQDEFKLHTWKSDSQDTTTTSISTSEQGNEDVTTILKNIPNVEFASKILENIKGSENLENDKKPILTYENKEEKNKMQVMKDTKSPRLALKDRVFRNVRTLIEKSNLSKGNDLISTIGENVFKTPTAKENPSVNVINSAPSVISADRPSRLKRKPKKFDDLELFGLKKRRNSSNPNDSPTDSEIIESITPENTLREISKEQEVTKAEVVMSRKTVRNEDNQKNSNVQNETNTCDIEANSEKHNGTRIDVIEDNVLTASDSSDTQNQQKINETTQEILTPLKEKETEIQHDTDIKDKNLSANSKLVEKNKLSEGQKSTGKKPKKSRIEKELAIDMVEGHPFLQVQSEKRLTRKAILKSPCTRNNIFQKSNKSKSDIKGTPKSEKKTKDKEKTIKETQNTYTEDMLASQDIIESSQESTLTTISVKSCKSMGKKIPIITLEDIEGNKQIGTQSLLDVFPNDNDFSNQSKDDIELTRNKTDEKVLIDLTENMDTETINEDDVIIINDDEDQPVPFDTENVKVETDNITVNTENIDTENIQIDIQNTNEADTQSLDPSTFIDEIQKDTPKSDEINITSETNTSIENTAEKIVDIDVTNSSLVATSNDETKTMSESVLGEVDKEDLNSPFKDEEQRKKDFLSNTLEISPIKTLSPEKEKKSPSPETSSDYVVIKLSSPVQSNGEPFEKVESPEIFTEDKISPDKRDQSPPREEVNVANSSPSTSLSLKKNRPQVRTGGRAAQMLGLCVPNRLQTIMMSDKSDSDESKKSPSLNTSARRNLRILYNTPAGETLENAEEQDTDSENFLKLKRNLPTTDCSPSGPILKRKLADITDETTASPASKRKRVSFHDPPVSTTICVKKYIEPCGLRSPQNSANKRQERQLRSHLAIKSPKRLDNVFKLDSVLTKTVESFTDSIISTNEDSEVSSIDHTPIAQVVKSTDLNDTDPICPELVDCKDSITNIASELSSPAMKELLITEFTGRIDTVGNLAKMTELEVNRLCIKAPKVEVAKTALNEYIKSISEIPPTVEKAMDETVIEYKSSVEVQTNTVTSSDIEMQTNELVVSSNSTQTDVSIVDCSSQTDESGSRTTADIVTSCLSERKDFVNHLCDKMDEDSKKKIVDNLPFTTLTDVLIKKLTTTNSDYILNKIIEERSNLENTNVEKDARLSVLQDYLCKKFESNSLVLFCSELLKRVYNKPS